MQTRIGAFKHNKLLLMFETIEEVRNNGWSTNKSSNQPPKEKKEEETTNQIDMKRIQEITCTKRIELDNVKVSFPIKLLQWQINNLLYMYNNKYAFPHTITNLTKELVDIVKKSKINEEKQSDEILTKARNLYTSLHTYTNTKDKEEENKAVDDSIRFILFNYSKKKNVMSVTQLVELLTEIKEMLSYISSNGIPTTERINNLSKLSQQLRERIVSQI